MSHSAAIKLYDKPRFLFLQKFAAFFKCFSSAQSHPMRSGFIFSKYPLGPPNLHLYLHIRWLVLCPIYEEGLHILVGAYSIKVRPYFAGQFVPRWSLGDAWEVLTVSRAHLLPLLLPELGEVEFCSV